MKKKIILITGSTDGIGKLTALKLAEEGHQMLLHGRNDEKLNRTMLEIQKTSKNMDIQGFVADFSNLNSVDQMIKAIKQSVPQLDVLINNAGVFNSSRVKNNQGIDLRFAVNYLAPYKLTKALLPLFVKANAARIINLSSAAQATVSLEGLKGHKLLSPQDAYAQSKLALTMWSFELAKQDTNATIIAVNPGSLLDTKMVQEAYGRSWSSAEKGANILCELAISEKFRGQSGKYFDNDKGGFSDAHADAYDAERIAALISATEAIESHVNVGGSNEPAS